MIGTGSKTPKYCRHHRRAKSTEVLPTCLLETSVPQDQTELSSIHPYHDPKMRGRQKKRKSTSRIYETVPNSRQSRIGPSPHRTIRDKHPTWSAPNLRQQSITQMDALRGYYHPELESEDLKTDDEEVDSYVASPTRNKRRKISPEKSQARRIETRGAKREAAKEEPSIREERNQDVLPSANWRAKAHISRATIPTPMRPPKTPVSLRRKEIPSSQSPADTPLSTQSRYSLQDYTRSPLKEKSTNIELCTKSPVKRPRWSKRSEVADSTETGDEDSPELPRVGLMSEQVGSALGPKGITEDEPQLPFHAFAIHVHDFNQRLEAAQRPVREIQNSSQARPRHEVIDSTDDENDVEGAEAFNAGPETQAALASTDGSQNSSNRPPDSMPSASKPVEDEPELPPIQRNVSESPDPLNAPFPTTGESNVEDQLPMQRSKRVEFVDLPSSDPPRPATPSQLSERPAKPDKVSAHFSAGLQTESQFEKGWITYTPADDIHSDLETLPSPPQLTQQPSSGLMTVPTQLIRPPISSPPKFYSAPIPPSQASTVDVTQPSPRNMPSPSQAVTQRSPRKPPSSSQAYLSSPPPPMPPPSSSPLASRKPDPWAGYEWNGVRLTDSQLLPDSLMDDSEVGPPGLSQESWVEEV